jgi:hypothetical protein
VRDSVVFVMVVLFLTNLSGNVLLQPFLRWHRELFFWLKHGGRQCWGGPKNRSKFPNTRFTNKIHKSYEMEIKNLKKPVLASKVVNPFTRALTPPFIGRRKDFYILKIPSNLGNIPSVNTYINVFYIP